MIEAITYFFKNFALLNGYFIYSILISILALGVTKKVNTLIILNMILFMFLIFVGVKELIPLTMVMFTYYFYKNYFGDD